MRVITTAAPDRSAPRGAAPSTRRAANIEALGLLAASLVAALGIALTCVGRLDQLARIDAGEAAPPVLLSGLRGAQPLVPLLGMFESPVEREAVAEALYARVRAADRPVEHVGALSEAAIPAARIQGDPGFVALRARLEQRPGAGAIPVLSAADLAAIKPRLVVRTRGQYAAGVRIASLWLFAAFWIAHLVRRWRRAADDPLVLPILMVLCGVGLMSMLALRDPLRDTMTARLFAAGVAAGVAVLLAVSEIDFEASRLRRAVVAPLGLALVLAAMLLAFGTGPGSSGVKVNLLGVQPVEAIRLLVVFALAAYFARRLEFLREYSEPPTPARPWLRYLRVPRWKDIRPVIVSMALVMAFFFLQKDLGPALVLSCVFLALYGIARGRAAFVLVGFGMLLSGFLAAYWIGFPSTVRQRVMIWSDPWNNGVPGGNQIAHGLWALSTGAGWGSGPGVGSPQFVPAAHTDFVLAAIGEELGFVGLLVIVGLYAMLTWRCLRVAVRAPGDYSSFLAAGVALALVVQALVIAGGVLGLFPLSGVVTPFLSYGRSSMLANFLAAGVVLAIARRAGPVRQHLRRPIAALGTVLVLAGAVVIARAAWVQVVRADELATASSVSEQADGGYRFEYNPRLIAASRLLVRGTIYDRNGLPLATSRTAEIATVAARYKEAGLSPDQPCPPGTGRCYPLAGVTFAVLGDWNHQTNWGARNSSYLERDSDPRLRGFDDRQQIVEVVNPRTGARDRAVKRDYADLLPLARNGYDVTAPAAQALVKRPRDLHSSIDARLQARTAAALRGRIERGGHSRGAAIVLDVATGDVLAAASYPWPSPDQLNRRVAVTREDEPGPWFDRVRYGLYPPGSTFKLLVAAAALRADRETERTFACVRLPDGRVGNRIPGWTRPVRDDLLDTTPHGKVDLRRGLVLSCNAYFAQLALRLGPRPIVEAASTFQIDSAAPATAESLRRTLPHAGYGQGEVLVTPLKLARVAASIAGGGKVLPVRWTTGGAAGKADEARFLSARDAAALARYMREVVTSGTGRALQPHPVAIAGKTGTAEIAGAAAHSWFTGFAPSDGQRRIAFAVLVENAGYGARTAAPIAGDIVAAARDLGFFRQDQP